MSFQTLGSLESEEVRERRPPPKQPALREEVGSQGTVTVLLDIVPDYAGGFEAARGPDESG